MDAKTGLTSREESALVVVNSIGLVFNIVFLWYHCHGVNSNWYLLGILPIFITGLIAWRGKKRVPKATK